MTHRGAGLELRNIQSLSQVIVNQLKKIPEEDMLNVPLWQEKGVLPADCTLFDMMKPIPKLMFCINELMI